MRIDYPAPQQLPRLRQLWQDTFSDDDAFLDLFFSSAFFADHCRCVTIDGQVAAALYWLDMSCRGKPMAYLYAVATGEDFRRRGLCRALMEDTHGILRDAGYAGAILVPEEETLAGMYASMGYRWACTISDFICVAGPENLPLRPIEGQEYARLRETLLPAGGVSLGQAALTFLEGMVRFYAGPGYAMAAVRSRDSLRCLELLGDPGLGPAILGTLSVSRGSFRTPGPGRNFAMYRSLDGVTPPPAYLGFAFD